MSKSFFANVSRLSLVLLLLTVIFALGDATVITQASNQQPSVPSGFALEIARPGVELYRNSSETVYVQRVRLDRGASVELRHGPITDEGIEKGPYGGNDPWFERQSIIDVWNDFSTSDERAFCLTNGQFFDPNYYTETRLAFSLKKDDERVSDGYAVAGDNEEFPGKKLMLEIWPNRADITPLTELAFEASNAPDIIAGLTIDAPKNPIDPTKDRTFVGLRDDNNDDLFETLLVLNSSGSTQDDAADELIGFGADPDKLMMLDGGSSTQLICKGEDEPYKHYLSSSSPIPQTLAVSSSDSATGVAQFGLSWLEDDAVAWQNRNRCIGCHVQPKAIQAAAIANDNGFTIDNDDLATLMDFMKSRQRSWGDFGGWPIGEEHHTAPGFAAYDRSVSVDARSNLVSLADWLLSRQQADGRWSIDRHEPPVDQGDILVTANAITALAQAYNDTSYQRFSTGMQLGAHWLESQTTNAVTTQDKAQIIIGLIASGRPLNDPAVQAMVSTLKNEQRADNGWSDTAGGSSTAYGTGQVLYALRLAGVRLDDPVVQSGVDWLIANQEAGGSWPLTDNADPRRRSKYSPTMWGVLGLVQTVDLTRPSIRAPILPIHVPKWVSLPIDMRDNIAGSGINQASIDVRVDGVSVPNFYIPLVNRVLVFVDPLETHTVTVDASDNQGNSAEQVVFTFTVDPSLLGVEKVSPDNGAINVPVESGFQATFNNEVDPATINGATVTLRDENENLVPGTVDFDSSANTATIQPVSPLDYSSYYILTVRGGDEGVRELNGDPMVMDFQFGFRTQSASGDVAPPTVTSVDLQTDGSITVRFSEPMDPLTVSGSTILLEEQSTGLDLSKTVSYDPLSDEASVVPLTPLTADKSYEVLVISGLGGVTDLAGNPLDEDFVAIIVINSSPLADAGSPYEGSEGLPITVDGSGSSDPDENIVLYEWDFDDDGEYDDATGVTADMTYVENGTYFVSLKVTDEYDESDTDTAEITVNNVAPAVTADPASQGVQYSDHIADVTITATDVAADAMNLVGTSWWVDGGGPAAGLLSDLSLTPNGCGISDGTNTCTWPLSGVVNLPAGSYTVRATVEDDDGGSTDVDITIDVAPEDTSVRFHGGNPVAVRVAEPGGDSTPFTLIAHVKELYPDAGIGVLPGDIALADADVRLAPVGAGPEALPTSCSTMVHDVDYDARLTATCEFDQVPVNTYTVVVTVGGGYYSGIGEDVVTVYDPSLGNASGAGTFLWPDTGESTRFGFTMEYNKKGTKVQGALLLIRYLPDGSYYKVKSNALYGLALGEDSGESYGWASFSGKTTYLDPAWPEALGNHTFKVYVEDRNEPGAGVDQFWIEVIDRDGHVIPAMSMDRDAVDKAAPLQGGNVVVPHQGD